ncbi:hypothetical protein SEA_GODONK_172 [Gordonia phage GodonK]|uniref:Uncharacterized protein n=1 Tax=Gordonia phage GodonK TaxID=2562192 RepID=A0A4D6E260_9CAUD|nr:hypothetical protein HOV33_gp196 [Gordonia phage GodonK]QBZ72760.1 hypothetical protein SEA_GODONK_172 [Gordonia phage GodonK]
MITYLIEAQVKSLDTGKYVIDFEAGRQYLEREFPKPDYDNPNDVIYNAGELIDELENEICVAQRQIKPNTWIAYCDEGIGDDGDNGMTVGNIPWFAKETPDLYRQMGIVIYGSAGHEFIGTKAAVYR